jgi:hypothetical protein
MRNSSYIVGRSGLWMTIKVVFHTFLIKDLGDISTVLYKLLITHFLMYVIHTINHSDENLKMSTDVLVHCVRKIVRRLNKIECLLESIEMDHIKEWVRHTKD